MPETVKLFRNTEKKDKNFENMPYLEIIKVILLYCNIIINDYQHSSRVFCTFVTNKSFGQLLDIYFTQKPYIFKNL